MSDQSEQLQQYDRDGFILVSNLISSDIVDRARNEMWELMCAKPNDCSTWPSGVFHQPSTNSNLLSCFTDEVRNLSVTLCNDSIDQIAVPDKVDCINAFPTKDKNQEPYPHLDHAIKEDGYRTLPAPYRAALIVYLTNVSKKGGGTILWPGSHKINHERVLADRERYEFMWNLNNDLDPSNYSNKILLQPKAGDVLFYHYLCAHTGSPNHDSTPRLALNHKWLTKQQFQLENADSECVLSKEQLIEI